MAQAKYHLLYTKEHNTFRAYYLEQFFSQWFDFTQFDVDQPVLSKHILLLSVPERANRMRFSDIPARVFETVNAIVVDNLQEPFLPDLRFLEPYKHKVLILTAGHGHQSSIFALCVIPEWFWYFESLWYRSRDYHSYQPQRSPSPKLFFMPMRRRRLGRDLVYENLASVRDQSIFSYVERGIELPGIPIQHREDQRWFNPDWYDHSCFSVVCEDDDDTYPICWSEKSCKPLAFFHPFVVVGQRGLLRLIRDHGFESFPEIFDESYDDLDSIYDRATHVCHQVKSMEPDRFCHPAIAQKTRHNQERFFDQSLVSHRMEQRLIAPMLEFFEAR